MTLTKEELKEIAWKEYEKIRDLSYKKYNKIIKLAYEKYQKVIEEIDNYPEEIPEIIEQNGRKYRLVEE